MRKKFNNISQLLVYICYNSDEVEGNHDYGFTIIKKNEKNWIENLDFIVKKWIKQSEIIENGRKLSKKA